MDQNYHKSDIFAICSASTEHSTQVNLIMATLRIADADIIFSSCG